MKTGESPRRPKPSQSLRNEVQMPLSGIFHVKKYLCSSHVLRLRIKGQYHPFISLFLSFFLSFFLFPFPLLLCSAQPRLVHAPVLRDTQCSGLLSGQGLHTPHLYAPRRHDALSGHVRSTVHVRMMMRGKSSAPALARSVNSSLNWHLNRIPCLGLT